MQRDVDITAMSGKSLVDRVVYDFPDQLVQTRRSGVTDVHAGAFTYRLHAFQDLNLIDPVITADLRRSGAVYRSIGRS